jgi:hypothetical protein
MGSFGQDIELQWSYWGLKEGLSVWRGFSGLCLPRFASGIFSATRVIPYLFSSFTAELFVLPSINNGYSDFLSSFSRGCYCCLHSV